MTACVTNDVDDDKDSEITRREDIIEKKGLIAIKMVFHENGKNSGGSYLEVYIHYIYVMYILKAGLSSEGNTSLLSLYSETKR